MRRGLSWALMATAALCVAALWLEDGPAKIVAAHDRPVVAITTPLAVPTTTLPRQITPLSLEPARRDIFVPVEPPAPKPVSPPPVLAQAPPSPPAPTAPAMTWRYLGAMVTPAGQRLVMLARGDSTVTVQPGTRLDEGYVVEAVGSDAIRLVYPPLGTVVDVPIPPAPPTPR